MKELGMRVSIWGGGVGRAELESCGRVTVEGKENE